MARKHEAVQWLRQGLSPAQIARKMGVSVATVMGYLYNQVGEGKIRRSHILLLINDATRHAVESVEKEHGSLDRGSFRRVIQSEHPEIDADEACVYRDLRKPEVYLGDMYLYLFTIEFHLHQQIKNVLMNTYGDDWWYCGIPENIRVECQVTRERDPDRAADPYCYTTLIHLKEIIGRRWNLFSQYLPKAAASNKSEFLAGLTRLNQLRNRVMHAAAKGIMISEDEFRSLITFLDSSDLLSWGTDFPYAGLMDEASATPTIQ